MRVKLKGEHRRSVEVNLLMHGTHILGCGINSISSHEGSTVVAKGLIVLRIKHGKPLGIKPSAPKLSPPLLILPLRHSIPGRIQIILQHASPIILTPPRHCWHFPRSSRHSANHINYYFPIDSRWDLTSISTIGILPRCHILPCRVDSSCVFANETVYIGDVAV